MPLRPFGITMPIPLAIAFGMSIVITAALYWFLVRTDTGRAIRATSQEPEAAALVGVNVDWMAVVTSGLATALACRAGVLLAPSLYLYPPWVKSSLQSVLWLLSWEALGSVPGAVTGCNLLGLVESLGEVLTIQFGEAPCSEGRSFPVRWLSFILCPFKGAHARQSRLQLRRSNG